MGGSAFCFSANACAAACGQNGHAPQTFTLGMWTNSFPQHDFHSPSSPVSPTGRNRDSADQPACAAAVVSFAARDGPASIGALSMYFWNGRSVLESTSVSWCQYLLATTHNYTAHAPHSGSCRRAQSLQQLVVNEEHSLVPA